MSNIKQVIKIAPVLAVGAVVSIGPDAQAGNLEVPVNDNGGNQNGNQGGDGGDNQGGGVTVPVNVAPTGGNSGAGSSTALDLQGTSEASVSGQSVNSNNGSNSNNFGGGNQFVKNIQSTHNSTSARVDNISYPVDHFSVETSYGNSGYNSNSFGNSVNTSDFQVRAVFRKNLGGKLAKKTIKERNRIAKDVHCIKSHQSGVDISTIEGCELIRFRGRTVAQKPDPEPTVNHELEALKAQIQQQHLLIQKLTVNIKQNTPHVAPEPIRGLW